MPRRRRAASERATLDPFVVGTGAAAPRDQRDLMERPFFSLAKSRRTRPILYDAGEIRVEVFAVAEHGMATIWDADVLIWAASQIVEAQNHGLTTSRFLRFTPYHLRQMWDRYGTIGAMLAAYNAGPGRYDDYVAKGRPLPAETRAYVAALAPILGGQPLRKGAALAAPVPADWRETPLFVVRLNGMPTASVMQPDDATDADPAATPANGDGTDSEPKGGLFVPRPGPGDRP